MRPLEDVRAIAVEQYGAGPFGTLHLAALGADIIKIEDPRTAGDVGRYVPPYTDGEDSLFFETFNRNKRSLSLDISTAAGREVFEDLVRHADAVYSNLRGDVPAKLRITYEHLKKVNPAVVCCSLSAFGMSGPRRAEPGYDYILQGLAGWMSLAGEPDGPPTKTGLSLVDYTGGLVAALALMAGVHAARRDGVGMDCDISLYDTAISLLTYPATWHMSAGFEPKRVPRSAHPSLVPFQNFQCADDWIVVGCAKEKFWQRLVDAIDRPELADDPRFLTFADRQKNAPAILSILDDVFAQQTAAHWLRVIGDAGVPCGPINDVPRALQDDQVAARNLVLEVEHPSLGRVRQLASPVRVGTESEPARRAPRRNEHATEILHDLLGYDDTRCAALAAGQAFG